MNDYGWWVDGRMEDGMDSRWEMGWVIDEELSRWRGWWWVGMGVRQVGQTDHIFSPI